MIKLISTDMDGTLLDENGNLPPDFYEVYNELLKRDIKFVIASGRPYVTLKNQFEDISESLTYICDNGAYIVDNNSLADISIIDKSCILRALELCDKLRLKVILCGTKGFYLNPLIPEEAEEILKYYISPVEVDDLYAVDDDIFKITILDLKGAEKNSAKEILPAFSDNYTAQVSGEFWIDIMNKGINKGSALSKIQQKFNIKRSETMTFGDYLNDIELLKVADYSYAVENAHPSVKQTAKFRAPENSKYGVTSEIKKILNI